MSEPMSLALNPPWGAQDPRRSLLTQGMAPSVPPATYTQHPAPTTVQPARGSQGCLEAD